jgi:hypothetical protein
MIAESSINAGTTDNVIIPVGFIEVVSMLLCDVIFVYSFSVRRKNKILKLMRLSKFTGFSVC